MAIMAGILRHRITIQTPTYGQDASGGVTMTWSDVKTVWAEITPLQGREYWEAQQVNAEIQGKIRMRYFNGLNPAMRVKFGDRYFHFESVISPKEKRELLDLYYTEATD